MNGKPCGNSQAAAAKPYRLYSYLCLVDSDDPLCSFLVLSRWREDAGYAIDRQNHRELSRQLVGSLLGVENHAMVDAQGGQQRCEPLSNSAVDALRRLIQEPLHVTN